MRGHRIEFSGGEDCGNMGSRFVIPCPALDACERLGCPPAELEPRVRRLWWALLWALRELDSWPAESDPVYEPHREKAAVALLEWKP